MKPRLAVACLSLLSLCGLAFAQKGAGADIGSNSGTKTWTSGDEVGGTVINFSFHTLHLNAPGRCRPAVETYCTGLPANCGTINVLLPFVCTAGGPGRCLSGSTLFGLQVLVNPPPIPCVVQRFNVAFWCLQR